MKNDYEVYDSLSLDAEETAVERGGDGVVTGWRLLKCGENELYKCGRRYVLTLTPEMLSGAVALQQEKGEVLPIDSRHALYWAAKKAGVEESEALRLVPQGTAALGFGSLALRDGDLWLTDVEWCPLAEELLKEKMVRYFSPVLRGMDGQSPFRVTSVAMDNVPALSGLEVLAASQEQQTEEKTMNRLEKALGKLLGENEIALGSEGDEAIAAKIEELAGKLAEMRQKLADAEAAIAALTEEKAAAETKAEALELSAEKEKKQSLITNALADGRITNAQAEALGRLDSVALGEFLAATKGRCVPGKGPAPKEEEKELALSDVEKDMARRMGISETEMLKTKKANCN